MYKNTKNFIFAIILMSLSFYSCISSRENTVTLIEQNSVPNNPESVISVPEENSDLDNSTTAVNTGKKIMVVSSDSETKKTTDKKESIILPIAIYKEKTKDITLISVSSPPEVANGKKFIKPFVFKAIDINKNPLKNIVLTLSYPSFSENGKVSFATEDFITNEVGEIVFNAPTPEFSCNSFVSCYVKPDKLDTVVSSYIEDSAVKSAYKVHTNKVWASFSISMLDYTEAGNPIKTNSLTSSAILQAMYKEGLKSVSNSDWINEIDTENNELLFTNAKKLFHNSINYLIHGKVKFVTPTAMSGTGKFTTTWHIEYSVMDMKTGKDILVDSFNATDEASTEWELFDTIRREKIAPVIANAIYYGL